MTSYLPEVDKVLRDNDIELSLITMQWFLTLFSGTMNARILVRVWDMLFLEGTAALFQVNIFLYAL